MRSRISRTWPKFFLPVDHGFLPQPSFSSQSFCHSQLIPQAMRLRLFAVGGESRSEPADREGEGRTWSLVINASEIRDIPKTKPKAATALSEVGDVGQRRDRRLLRRIEKKFPSLKQLEKNEVLLASEGLQLRLDPKEEDDERETKELVEPVDEIVGKNLLDIHVLKKLRHLFTFPSLESSLSPNTESCPQRTSETATSRVAAASCCHQW